MLTHLNYDALAHLLSAERLATYLHAGGYNHEKAVNLYMHNLNQSCILYGKLHWLEVGLRNAMNRQLSQKYGLDWFNNRNFRLNEKDIS